MITTSGAGMNSAWFQEKKAHHLVHPLTLSHETQRWKGGTRNGLSQPHIWSPAPCGAWIALSWSGVDLNPQVPPCSPVPMRYTQYSWVSQIIQKDTKPDVIFPLLAFWRCSGSTFNWVCLRKQHKELKKNNAQNLSGSIAYNHCFACPQHF